jgi:hypothetical protein
VTGGPSSKASSAKFGRFVDSFGEERQFSGPSFCFHLKDDQPAALA